jgi:hypothetical protein
MKKGRNLGAGCTLEGSIANEELEALLEAGALAGALTQVIQAGAADLAVSFDNHFFQARGAAQEGTFNAHTIAGYTAHGKAGIGTILMRVQNCTFKFLNTFAVAFRDLHMHTDNITGFEVGHIRVDSGLNRLQ